MAEVYAEIRDRGKGQIAQDELIQTLMEDVTRPNPDATSPSLDRLFNELEERVAWSERNSMLGEMEEPPETWESFGRRAFVQGEKLEGQFSSSSSLPSALALDSVARVADSC